MNMKPTLTFLTTLLLAPVAAHADLVAHLRFDGDLKDAAGRHDGRPVLGRDETDPVVILKRAHLAPDGRCGHTQRAGRGGEAALARNLEQRPDLTEANLLEISAILGLTRTGLSFHCSHNNDI